MVTYIRSDLDFILDQIKIAEAHALGQPLFGTGGLVPAYNLSLGLRTVDGTYNHLLPGQERWGAADSQFPTLLDPAYRPAENIPPGFGPPGPPIPTSYTPSNSAASMVFDSSLRTISNLLVDQTLGNPAAILTGLERAGSANPMLDLPAVTAIYQAFKPAWDAEYQARVVMQEAQKVVDVHNDDESLDAGADTGRGGGGDRRTGRRDGGPHRQRDGAGSRPCRPRYCAGALRYRNAGRQRSSAQRRAR